MPVSFSDNFDADAVGSTQVANWTNQGTQPTVTAGSTLSAPNWYNSPLFSVYRTSANLTGGALQFSSYAGTDGTNYFGIVPSLSFDNANATQYLIEPRWNVNLLVIQKYTTTNAVTTPTSVAQATIPAYANGAGYTLKMQFDPSTSGGPTISVKVWPYGTAEPTPWTTSYLDASTTGGPAPPAGSKFRTQVIGRGAFVVSNQGIDDYYEGTVGTTFVVAGAAVTTLTITVSGNNRILTWPADAQATAYEVYRGATATTLAFVATVATGTTTYTDAARPGGNIYYAVIAVH